jgi:Fic family protein
MRAALDDLERFMHERTLRPLLQMAVLHYQFEAIHPFGDGNGRVGRLLMGIFLAQRGLMPQPLLYLSAFFERNRTEYYDLLMRVSTHGDWDAWVQYVLRAVAAQADEAAEVADKLQELQQRYRDDLQGRRATATALAVVDGLFVNPLMNTRLVQDVLGVSAPTARAAITALVDAGVLTEITGRRRDRVYRADEIFAVMGGRHEDVA